MANTVGTLLVELRANTDLFRRGMEDARRLSFDSAENIVGSLKKVSDQITRVKFDNLTNSIKSLEKVGGIMTGVAVGVTTAVVALTAHTAEQVEQMGRLAQSYGLSVETISGLRVAAKMADMDLETLTMGFGRLSRSAAMVAQSGRETGGAFERIGVRVTDANGRLRPMNDLLLDVADRFSKMEDGTTKTALAMQIFGRSGATLIPFFNRGKSDIQELIALSNTLGLTWSEKDAVAAERLGDAIKLQELKMMALKEQLAMGLLPKLSELSNAFIKVDVSGNSAARNLGSGIGDALIWLTKRASDAATGFELLWMAFEKANNTRKAWNPLLKYSFQQRDIDNYWIDRRMEDALNRNNAFKNAVDEPYKPPVSAPRVAPPSLAGGGVAPDSGKVAEDKTFENFARLSERTRGLLNSADGDRYATQISNVTQQIAQLQQFLNERPGQFWPVVIDQINELRDTAAKLSGQRLAELQQKSRGEIAGILGANTTAVPRVSGEVQVQAESLRLQQDVNEQNRIAAELYSQTRTAGERWAQELTKLNFLKQTLGEDTYNRTLQQAKDNLSAAFDPQVRYNQALREYNSLLQRGALTPTAAREWRRQLTQMELDTNRSWKGISQAIASSSSSALDGWIRGTQTFGQAWAHAWQGIIITTASGVQQTLMQMALLTLAGKANAAKEILTDAKVSASHAFKWVMASVPFPANAILAPIAAGTAFAANLAFASAANGWDKVPRDQFAMVHKNEMVLSAPIAGVIRELPQMVQSSRGGSEPTNVPPMRLGDIHIHGAQDPDAVANKVRKVVLTDVKNYFKSNGVNLG